MLFRQTISLTNFIPMTMTNKTYYARTNVVLLYQMNADCNKKIAGE